MSSTDADLSTDDVFHILSDAQRRALLSTLLEADIDDDPPSDGGCEITVAHEIKLNHVHLPKLAANDIIEWDQTDGDVRPGPAFSELRPVLRLLYNHRERLPAEWA